MLVWRLEFAVPLKIRMHLHRLARDLLNQIHPFLNPSYSRRVFSLLALCISGVLKHIGLSCLFILLHLVSPQLDHHIKYSL